MVCVEGILFIDEKLHSYDHMAHLDYTVQPGDTLSSICAAEGVTGDDIADCVTHTCNANTHTRMPGTTRPVFRTMPVHDLVVANCDSMQDGAVISVPDVNGNGRAGE